jgi:hypothetical protein
MLAGIVQSVKLTAYVLEARSFIPRKDRNISVSHNVPTFSELHLLFYPMGTGIIYSGVKRPERDGDCHFFSEEYVQPYLHFPHAFVT